MRKGKLVRYDEFRDMAERLSLPAVPELYRGPPDMEVFQQLICEPFSVNSSSPREGIAECESCANAADTVQDDFVHPGTLECLSPT